MTAATTYIERTGGLEVHHPITWTPAPRPCRHCGYVHQPAKLQEAAR